ncbi:MAG: outer membrane protein assembly factor BamE [Rhodomicrobium sp.]|nr:outer membrane protein assembly factor BamE [Rhodomicrobium sp.]
MKNVAFIGAKPEADEKKCIRRRIVRSLSVIGLALCLSACAADITKHGHVFTDEDLAQVKEGMSRDQVILALGTPDTKSTIDQNAFYYISTTTKRSAAFLNPTIVDRRVVAVYFDNKEIVSRVANYGLQDGRVVDLVNRTTPSRGSEDGLLKELFRNIGRANGAPVAGGGSGIPGGY